MSHSTIVGRGTARYKITRTGHSFDVSVWCDCILAEHARHWHLLSQHRTTVEAEFAVDTHETARHLVAP